MIPYAAVSVDEVLCVLAARTNAPSAMGEQIDRMQESAHAASLAAAGEDLPKIHEYRDAWHAQENAENRIMRDIAVFRCLDTLACTENVRGLKGLPTLVRLSKAVRHRTKGELVIQCLRAHAMWATQSKERALAEVYVWAHGHAPDLFPAVNHKESSLWQAFRVGSANKARQRASNVYADCYLVMADWVAAWNRRQIRLVAS
jgi:hypothetical protein